MYFFWTHGYLNVENDTENKHTLQRRQENFVSQGTFFYTNSYANIILVSKFVAGLSRFGYDCCKIVGSLLNLEKTTIAISKFKWLLCTSCIQEVLFFWRSLLDNCWQIKNAECNLICKCQSIFSVCDPELIRTSQLKISILLNDSLSWSEL